VGQGRDIESPEANFLPPLKSDEDISEDEVDLVSTPKMSTGSHQPKSEQPEQLASEDYHKHFSKGKPPVHPNPIQKFGQVINNVDAMFIRRGPDSGPDELALEETRPRRPPKRRAGLSSSLSKKGDIQRTKFTGASTANSSTTMNAQLDEQKRKAALIIGNGLRIERGACGRCLYQVGDAGGPEICALSMDKISHTLRPVDQDNIFLEPYQYLTLNLWKVKSIISAGPPPAKSRIVSVNYVRSDPANSMGIKLMLEFASYQETSKFLEWATLYRESRQKELAIMECPV
jgi:hypothetical protein